MKSVLFLAILALVSMAADAAGWRYLVYESGTLVYDGPSPPVDLGYPPPGQPTPFATAASTLRGTLLTPEAAAQALTRPHVVVIPPTAIGNRQPETSTENTEQAGY